MTYQSCIPHCLCDWKSTPCRCAFHTSNDTLIIVPMCILSTQTNAFSDALSCALAFIHHYLMAVVVHMAKLPMNDTSSMVSLDFIDCQNVLELPSVSQIQDAAGICVIHQGWHSSCLDQLNIPTTPYLVSSMLSLNGCGKSVDQFYNPLPEWVSAEANPESQ